MVYIILPFFRSYSSMYPMISLSARLPIERCSASATTLNFSIISRSVLIAITGLLDDMKNSSEKVLTRCVHLCYILGVNKVYTPITNFLQLNIA